MISPFLRGDDQNQSDSSDGVKAVKLGPHGQTLQVKKTGNPYQHVSSSSSAGKYQPDQPNYSRTSSFSNKRFSSSTSSLTQKNSSLEEQQQRTFITKSYFSKTSFQTDTTTPHLNTKISPTGSNAYRNTASGFDKSFATNSSSEGKTKTALFANTKSSDQGRTALLGGKKIEGFPSTSLVAKPYLGPEVTAAQKDSQTVSNALSRVSGLPNRPLTIDEVRALINHDTKPDTDARPEPASKPLNDPDYKPTVSPEPPPAATGPQGDAVPPPGTMAAPPENSEPLPK